MFFFWGKNVIHKSKLLIFKAQKTVSSAPNEVRICLAMHDTCVNSICIVYMTLEGVEDNPLACESQQNNTNNKQISPYWPHCITENVTYHDPITENLTYHEPQNFASTSSAEMPCFFSTFACTRAWRQLGCLNNLIWGALPKSDIFYLWKLGWHWKIPPVSMGNTSTSLVDFPWLSS